MYFLSFFLLFVKGIYITHGHLGGGGGGGGERVVSNLVGETLKKGFVMSRLR